MCPGPFKLFSAVLFCLALHAAGAETQPPAAVPPTEPRRALPVEPFAGQPLNLKTCYELALLRMESVGLRDEDVRVAQARYREAIGAILPNVTLTGNQYFYKDQSSSFSSFSTGGNTSAAGPVGTSDLTPRMASVDVKVPLFSGLRDVELAHAAKAQIEGNRQTAQRIRQSLYLDVAESFYQTLDYEEDLRILADVETTLQDRVKELEKRVRLGKSRDSELLDASTSLAQTKVSVEHTRGLLSATREMLAFLIGLPSEQITLRDDSPPAPGSLALAEYLNQVAGRPDVLAAVQAEQAARAQLSAAKGEHWPKLSFEGNYTLYDSSNLQTGNWYGFLTLEVPVFDGGSIEARVDQNKSLYVERRLDLAQLQREAERDIRTYFNQFNLSLAELVRLEEAVKTSGLNYQAQRSDYELKIVNNLDVLSALYRFQNLRRDENTARMNTRLNLIKLYVAAGSVAQGSGRK
ncbi:MAG: TolC family protein [Methylacidiphilales bacterium]|nr:TolC family protein [Candidatus Methylacidiphilales bacterium]